MSTFYSWTFLGLSLVLCSQCKNEPTVAKNADSGYLDIHHIDTTVSPGDNYFKYVNETWNKTTTIPSTEVGVGSFFDLQTKSEEALLEVCKEAAAVKDAAPGSLEQRVGDLYTSIMDTAAIEAKGFNPLKPIFERIDQIKNQDDLIAFASLQQINGNNILFGFSVNPDDKNSSKNIAQFLQGGIGLPDRDYYFRSDEQSKAVRVAYHTYLKKIFMLIGDDSTKAMAHADEVIRLESNIAKGHFTNVELRDPQKNYNKYGAGQLQKMSPGLDWNKLKSQMLIKTDSLMIGQPSFFTSLDKLIKATPVDQWKPYLKATTVSNSYNSLSKAFADAGFEFFQKTLSGRQEPQPRWKYAANVVDSRIGDLSGQLYVKKHFDAKAKARMTELIDNLTATYGDHIKSLEWMSEITKTKALEKLAAITRKIGYPDKWKTYDSLVITKNDYFQNRINTDRNAYFKAIAKIDQPVDKTEWP
ncbi:MAG: M13 family metallopeptidase, partial [Saprospiraceae bacterium]